MRLSEDAIEGLKILVEACQSLSIELALIGASALVIYSQTNMLRAEAVESTRDIDAITSALDWEQHDNLIEELIKRGFRKGSGEAEHKLYYEHAEFDILPIGKHLLDGQDLVWRISENRMNAQGLQEALVHGIPFEVEDGLQVLVAPLWLIVYLKINAYLDNPHTRHKDIRDVLGILEYYEYDPEESRRFDVDADIDHGLRGAFLIGLDITANLEQVMLEPIREFLANIEDEDSSIISRAVGHSSLQLREAFQLFEAMKQGLLNAG
ncbi:MAG: hypothetical protein Q8J63_05325 [Candidatus Aquicultor sp.]|nr:hypothetical protein [Candidatus Aquicultor sp.]